MNVNYKLCIVIYCSIDYREVQLFSKMVGLYSLSSINMAGRLFHIIHQKIIVQRLNSIIRLKTTLDYSRIPKLSENDLEEKFVRGHGPGGQSVQKTSNCVVLTHLPTGFVVKCHKSRSLDENRKEARKLLVDKLDKLYNGENSIEAQSSKVETKKFNETIRRQKKIDDMKKKWKEREKMT